MSDRPTYIYALCEPGTEVAAGELPPPSAVRYVGKADDLTRRFWFHYSTPRHTHCSSWIRSLRAAGKRPLMIALETVATYNDWPDRERHWIAYYRTAGARLTNLTDGGEGVPPEIVAAQWADPLKRLARIAAITAGKSTPEARERIRRTSGERAKEPARRLAQSIFMQARMADPAVREEISRLTTAALVAPARRATKRQRSRENMERDPEAFARFQAAQREFWSRPENQQYRRDFLAADHADPVKGPARRAAARESLKRPDVKAKMSAGQKAYNKLPETKARKSAEMSARNNAPGAKEKTSEQFRALWADPEWKAKTLASRAAKKAQRESR